MKIPVTAFLIVAVFSSFRVTRTAGGSDAKLASEFTVNLDLPPAQRWTENGFYL